jgi:type II restriction/modification system DNA methylase subunit YeeA
MTPQQFIAKWQRVTLSERSACQQHFLDLCDLLGQPKPAEVDPEGTWYTFEKGVEKTEGGYGWADVWMRDHFGWEYKRRHKDLKTAYSQLLLYREDLENPPLLVVCDMDRFEVHTNFTGTAKHVHVFDLAGLADPANLEILRKLFADPNSLRPGITSEKITVEAAQRFAKLADGMRDKGIEPLRAIVKLFVLRIAFPESIIARSIILMFVHWHPRFI